VALRPAQIHAQEHLRPVGRLGAACARADRQERRALVVLAGEEQRRALRLEGPCQGVGFAVQLALEVGVVALGEEVEERDDVVGPVLQATPRGDLRAQAVGLAEDLLGGALVVPEAGLERLRVEPLKGRFLGG
jgi:hypothetical protein